MDKTTGINIILADSMEEVNLIAKIVGSPNVFQFKSFEQMCLIDPDAVYYAVLPTHDQMYDFIKYFNVRRGVVSSNGRRDMLGFNVDWMKKLIKAPKAEIPRQGFQMPEERDDPYTSLGYR